MGQLADIAQARGDLDDAAALQHKRLEGNRQLNDLGGIAAASWELAQIDLARGNHPAALPRLTESFALLRQLQRRRWQRLA